MRIPQINDEVMVPPIWWHGTALIVFNETLYINVIFKHDFLAFLTAESFYYIA
jgi:hypothetical protein